MRDATRSLMVSAIMSSLFCSAGAWAAPVEEQEPNNSLASAQFIAEEFYPFGAVAIAGSIAPDDMDVFSFDVEAGTMIVASVFSLNPTGDPVLGIYDPTGALYSLVDDTVGLNPVWQGVLPTTGTWRFVVGGNDEDIFGAHGTSFDYLMSWTIPEPATLALCALAFPAYGRRVRRRSQL